MKRLRIAVLVAVLIGCGETFAAPGQPPKEGQERAGEKQAPGPFFAQAAVSPAELGSAAPAQQQAAVTVEDAAKPRAQAAESVATPESLAAGMDGAISLDLRNIDIVDALKFLATKAGLNIITTKSVTGRVTLLVNKAVIRDVFDIMLRSNNLAYDKRGDIYNVMSQEEYKNLYGRNFSDVRTVKVFYLNYTVPEQAFSLLDMLKSEIGRVMVDPESGNVLVMDSPSRVELMGAVLKDFEEKNTVRIFKLNYAKAKDVEEALKSQLDTKKVGLVKADEKGNQIIVQTLPERMAQIEKLIGDLDSKTKEIIIDVSIVQVSLSDEDTQGIKWEGLGNLGLANTGLSYLGSTPFSSVQSSTDSWRSRLATFNTVGGVGSYPFSGTSTSLNSSSAKTGTEEMHLGLITNKFDFDVVLKYLQTIGKTKILSNPKIAVTNHQEAKLHVGQKEAYVTTTTTTGQTTNTVSEQVTFVDVGIIMSVVPAINDDGYIVLKLKAEINSVVDTLVTPTNNKIPIIDTSLAETTIMAKEGSTVMIGGLKKDLLVENRTQTPLLGRIPFLGALFRQSTVTKSRSELLIMLTPKIITGDALTGPEGRPAGEPAFKSQRTYNAKPRPVEEADTSIFNPAAPEDKKLNLKGFK